ncbi:MAG: hypothetical protein GWO10_14815 [candidate division Zixibacteria bacterium]|nr:hypothetical protein [Phycisphaerae bacterium]NIR65000.1 hypothetical protein [candidate division Zixibacteria bacterium]NIS54871.1 hypothetical protein [Phycisphaerae bacterium]NIW45795.1 hypothetical protein [Gammaproteobacteria bacterium]NIX02728.1 hypothetical protein [Phycisphaerae bacterium]
MESAPLWWVLTDVHDGGRGFSRPGWDLVYNHYVNRLGKAAPFTEQYAQVNRPEGGGFNYGSTSGGFDGLGFTTLTHSRDPIASSVAPSNLLPYVRGRQITLSWAGSAYANSYNVKRSNSSGGPYTTLAQVGTENLFYVDPGLTAETTYYYVVSANTPSGETANSAELAVTTDGFLWGTVIGTDGSWGDSGADKYCVFDDSPNSYFDPPTGGAWAGIDLGSGVSAVCTEVRYAPREMGFEYRMIGTEFQGSNDGSNWTTFYTLTTAPPADEITSQSVSNSNAYRYYRIHQGSSEWLNVSEAQFIGTSLSGLSAPSAPSSPTVTADDHRKATLSWSAVSDADSYDIKRATTSGGPYIIAGNTTYTNFVDSDLDSGMYYWVISAVSSAGKSGNSGEVSAEVLENVALGLDSSAYTANAYSTYWDPYSEAPDKAFDGKDSTKWYTGDGYSSGWLQADLGAGNEAVVIRYDLTSADDVPDRDPEDWELLGSNDGSNWTVLDSQTNESFAERYQTNQYSISNSTAYRYYLLDILSNANGTNGIQLAELALMAVAGPDVPDTDPPTPDPMTWATLPYATGSSSIRMVATTASDPSGAEYYFTCTAGGGNDSGWQDSTEYEDTGLSPETSYTYTVKARDKSTNLNETAVSSAESATTDPFGGADDTAGGEIAVQGSVSGSYTDTQVSDNTYESITEVRQGNPAKGFSSLEHKWTINVTGGTAVTFYVEAYKTAGSDGDDFVFAYSTDDSVYTNMVTVSKTSDDNGYQSYAMPSSLSGTVYIRVVDTDSTAGNQAMDTLYVDHMYIHSDAGAPDTTPPTPDPMTWATLPYATGSSSIRMVATTASDPSGVEYYFTCTAGGGNDSGWQDSDEYEDTGLSPETTYTYTVKARDKSGNQNETAVSSAESAVTDPAGPEPDMYVNDIEMSWRQGGRKYYGRATVWIKDDTGANVEGAMVYGNWSGAVNEPDSGITLSDGTVLIESSGVKDGGTFTFSVTDVVKSGYVYNPVLNVETSDSIDAP